MTGPKTNEREGTRALLRGAPMSAFKVREVLDLIRGQEVGRAAEILRFCERGPAEAIGKVLKSAVANAAHNDELDPEELFVSACYADESKTQRRMRPRARGRATRIRKRSSHITVIVSRLPEDRLGRLRAARAAEQANRRARRAGGRPAAAPVDRARRTGRAPAATEATGTVAEPEILTAGLTPDVEVVGADDVVETAVETDAVETDAVETDAVEEAAGTAGTADEVGESTEDHEPADGEQGSEK